MKWREQAACREWPVETFFPSTADGLALAREVCASCPVKRACLDDALSERSVGVRAGTTGRERSRMRGEQRRWNVRRLQAEVGRLRDSGLTSAEVAEMFGCSPSNVRHHWKAG